MSNDVKITDNTDELLAGLLLKEEKALVTVGMEAEGDAKIEIESSPRRVDTGRLRNSITWAIKTKHSSPQYIGGDGADEVDPDSGVREDQVPDEKTVVIGTNVEYAAKIHEGDADEGLDPNRFLRNAVENNAQKYREIIDDTLKEE